MYILGKILSKDKKAVAVVGSRNATPRGIILTKKYSAALTRAGFTIVSGLARGIDTEAHKTALACGGRTLAVLGSGIDVIYPPENKSLAMKIAGRGALISPFPMGTKPEGKNFLARNKIIVELSIAVLVIEGARRSGTLSTASHAANSGVDVYVIPGSPATDWLLTQGAIQVDSEKALLDSLR